MDKDKKDVTIKEFNDAIDALLQPPDGICVDEPDDATERECMIDIIHSRC